MSAKTGVWIIGARGGVATCLMAGLAGIRRGLCGREGLVTERPVFAGLGLVPLDGLVFGGHEIRKCTLRESAAEIRARAGSLSPELLAAIGEDLDAADAAVRPGTALGCGKAITGLDGVTGLLEKKLKPAKLAERLAADIAEFGSATGADRVVAINLSSTEPYRPELPDFYRDLASFEKALEKGEKGLSAATVYAHAAFRAGAAYVNFTPSVASEVPALRELAEKLALPHCGKDGKTGETLMKTALAPMFVERNLRVLSWEGYNIFGNRDAVVLDDPVNNLAKTSGKDAALRSILGDDRTHTRVRIDYCPSLDDWKTAWDFIHFQGWCGTRMILQFIWQGCDSMLAAPLAADLVRLTDASLRRGEKGVMGHVSAFFKQPVDGDSRDFFAQSRKLEDYVRERSRARPA
jgi:myo-inositol-1-phosphate synthase